MAHQVEESDLLLHPVRSRLRGAPAPASRPSQSHAFESHKNVIELLLRKLPSILPCDICIKSKAVMLILVWSVIIGAIYLLLLNGFGVMGFSLQRHIEYIKKDRLHVNVLIITVILAYAFLAIILLVYPLSGYFADVWCGRYKAVIVSLILLCVALLLLCCAAIIGIRSSWRKDSFGLGQLIPFVVLLTVMMIMIIISLSCYQANIIQLGLDQLLEAPSEKLSQFIHWLMWAYTLGSFIPLIMYVFLPCSYNSTHSKSDAEWIRITSFMPFPALLLLSLLLAFTCYNKSWFYSEPGQNDPYKTVYRVVRFAWKNKFPIRRSAFTYCDDFMPSRIDFAKERYGGPFTTSQVEDVKTFLRIVKVLVALGPIFIVEVPGSYYLFPLFALHIDSTLQFQTDQQCHSVIKWVLVQSGSLGYISSVIFFPMYIWLIFSLLRRRIPKILNRLKYAVCMPVAGVLCLLITDLIGHYRFHQNYPNNSTGGVCLFTSRFVNPEEKHIPNLLDMHWGVVIPPCILFSLGYLLVQSTAVEFILAQSPHSMKGLLVGVFFSIKGLFQFISAAAVIPFAIPSIWNDINSVTNCGFGYYLFTAVVGLVGLVVLSFVVRSYKYRQRDERPFDTRFAEQYYEKDIHSSQNPVTGVGGNSDRCSHTYYGTTRNSDYGVIEDHDEMNICLKDSASQSYERLN